MKGNNANEEKTWAIVNSKGQVIETFRTLGCAYAMLSKLKIWHIDSELKIIKYKDVVPE